MAGTKRVTTLELNLTSRTAKGFLADLAREADNTRNKIAQMTADLANAKKLGSKRLEADTDASYAERLEKITNLPKEIKKAQDQLNVFNTILQGNVKNINALAEAIDTKANMSLKRMQQAMKEYQDKMKGMGKVEDADKFLAYAAKLNGTMRLLQGHVAEVKRGFQDVAKEARAGLDNVGKSLNQIPNLLTVMRQQLDAMPQALGSMKGISGAVTALFGDKSTVVGGVKAMKRNIMEALKFTPSETAEWNILKGFEEELNKQQDKMKGLSREISTWIATATEQDKARIKQVQKAMDEIAKGNDVQQNKNSIFQLTQQMGEGGRIIVQKMRDLRAEIDRLSTIQSLGISKEQQMAIRDVLAGVTKDMKDFADIYAKVMSGQLTGKDAPVALQAIVSQVQVLRKNVGETQEAFDARMKTFRSQVADVVQQLRLVGMTTDQAREAVAALQEKRIHLVDEKERAIADQLINDLNQFIKQNEGRAQDNVARNIISRVFGTEEQMQRTKQAAEALGKAEADAAIKTTQAERELLDLEHKRNEEKEKLKTYNQQLGTATTNLTTAQKENEEAQRQLELLKQQKAEHEALEQKRHKLYSSQTQAENKQNDFARQATELNQKIIAQKAKIAELETRIREATQGSLSAEQQKAEAIMKQFMKTGDGMALQSHLDTITRMDVARNNPFGKVEEQYKQTLENLKKQPSLIETAMKGNGWKPSEREDIAGMAKRSMQDAYDIVRRTMGMMANNPEFEKKYGEAMPMMMRKFEESVRSAMSASQMAIEGLTNNNMSRQGLEALMSDIRSTIFRGTEGFRNMWKAATGVEYERYIKETYELQQYGIERIISEQDKEIHQAYKIVEANKAVGATEKQQAADTSALTAELQSEQKTLEQLNKQHVEAITKAATWGATAKALKAAFKEATDAMQQETVSTEKLKEAQTNATAAADKLRKAERELNTLKAGKPEAMTDAEYQRQLTAAQNLKKEAEQSVSLARQKVEQEEKALAATEAARKASIAKNGIDQASLRRFNDDDLALIRQRTAEQLKQATLQKTVLEMTTEERAQYDFLRQSYVSLTAEELRRKKGLEEEDALVQRQLKMEELRTQLNGRTAEDIIRNGNATDKQMNSAITLLKMENEELNRQSPLYQKNCELIFQGNEALREQKRLIEESSKLESQRNVMEQQFANLATLGSDDLKKQKDFWDKLARSIENDITKANEYAEAVMKSNAVRDQQKTNAMSNLGLTANGTSFDVGTTGMLAQLNDDKFPKTIEWLNKLKQEVEAFKTKFVTTPEGAQMLNQQLEIANTQLQALGATAASTGQQNLFTLDETKQKMGEILANMAARKSPFDGTSSQIEKMNASLKKLRDHMVKTGEDTTKVDRAIRGMKGALDTSKVSMQEFDQILRKPKKCDDIEKLNHVLGIVRERAKAAGYATAEQANQMRQLDKRAKELNQSFGYHASTLEQAASRLKSYIMIYMGFNAMMMKARQAIQSNLALTDSISNIQKVSNATETEVQRLTNAIQRLDARTKNSELMQIAYQGGKMGVAYNGGMQAMEQFVESANKLNSALGEDFGGAEAVGKLTKLTQTMGVAARDCHNLNDALERTGSAILTLGNNTTANYAYINGFATRLGGIAKAADISMPDLLAIGATMDVMGLQAEMSATAMTKFIATLSKKPDNLAKSIKLTGDGLERFNAAIKGGDTMGAIQEVFRHLHDGNVDLKDMANVLKDMVGGGNNTRALQVLTAMSKNYETLKANVDMANEAFLDGTAIQKEYDIMNENAAAHAARMGNAIGEIFTNTGSAKAFATMMKGLADSFEWLENHIPTFFGMIIAGFATAKVKTVEFNNELNATWTRLATIAREGNIFYYAWNIAWTKVKAGWNGLWNFIKIVSKGLVFTVTHPAKAARIAWGTSIRAIKASFTGLWTGTKLGFAGLLTAGKMAFGGLIGVAKTAGRAIAGALRTVWIFAVIEAVTFAITKFIEWRQEATRLGEAIKDAQAEMNVDNMKQTGSIGSTIEELRKLKQELKEAGEAVDAFNSHDGEDRAGDWKKQADEMGRVAAEYEVQSKQSEYTRKEFMKQREEWEKLGNKIEAATLARHNDQKETKEEAREQDKLNEKIAKFNHLNNVIYNQLINRFNAQELVNKGIIDEQGNITNLAKAYDVLSAKTEALNMHRIGSELKAEEMSMTIKEITGYQKELEGYLERGYQYMSDEKRRKMLDPTNGYGSPAQLASDIARQMLEALANGRSASGVDTSKVKKLVSENTEFSRYVELGDLSYRSTRVNKLITQMSDAVSKGNKNIKRVDDDFRTFEVAPDQLGLDGNTETELDLDGKKDNVTYVEQRIATKFKDYANEARQQSSKMYADLEAAANEQYAQQDVVLQTTLQSIISHMKQSESRLLQRTTEYILGEIEDNPIADAVPQSLIDEWKERLQGNELGTRALEQLLKNRDIAIKSAEEGRKGHEADITKYYMGVGPNEGPGADKKGNEAVRPKELNRLLAEVKKDLQAQVAEDIRKQTTEDAAHTKQVLSALLEGNPLMKVQDDFVKTLDQLDLFYAKSRDFSTEATKRRIDILSAYTAQITTMTEEEFVERIRLQREYADLTETEAKVLYDKLLKYRDDYDEAARKQAKQSLKLLTNRVESGEYYAQQLASLRKYQEELVKAGKTGTEAYLSVARAIEVVGKKQNMLVDGKQTTYQQRMKQMLESANRRVKMEEGVKNSGVNNGVQLGQAKLRVATTDFAMAMEEYQIRREEANRIILDVLKQIEDAKAAMDALEEGTEEHEKARIKFEALGLTLKEAKIKEAEYMADTYDKMLEKQRAVAEQEAEIQAERINSVQEFAESFRDVIERVSMADITARDAKAFELSKLRYEKELGLVQDFTRQRFLVIRKDGDNYEKWMTQEEAILFQQQIDAQNQRREALAEGLKNFGEKIGKQLRDAMNRQMELRDEERKERDRQKVIQNVQAEALAFQRNAEHNQTLFLKSELDSRLEYWEDYYSKLRTLSPTLSLNGEGAAKQNGATTNRTNQTNVAAAKGGNQTTNNANGANRGTTVRSKVGDRTLSEEQLKRMVEIANGSVESVNAAKQQFAQELGMAVDDFYVLFDDFTEQFADMLDNTITKQELVVTASAKPQPKNVATMQAEAVAMVDEKEWGRLWQSALSNVNIDSVIFDAISSSTKKGAFGPLTDKEAWKSIGISLGMNMATAASGVLTEKLGEWLNKKVIPNWGEHALGAERKATGKVMDEQLKLKAKEATVARKRTEKEYGEGSDEAKQAELAEAYAETYRELHRKAMDKLIKEANDAQDAMKKAVGTDEYSARRTEYMQKANAQVDEQEVTEQTIEAMGGKYGDSEMYQQFRAQNSARKMVTDQGWKNMLGENGDGSLVGTTMGDVLTGQAEQDKIAAYVAAWAAAYDEIGAKADETMNKALANDKTLSDDAKAQVTQQTKDVKVAFDKQQKAGEAKEKGLQVASMATAAVSSGVQDMITQASGNAMLGQMSGTLAQVGGNVIAGIASGSAKTMGEMGWWGAVYIPLIQGALMALLGLATSKMKKAQTEVSQATGVSSGKLTTGMLTYATGRYLDDEELKKGRITAGMMTMSDGYQPGQSYSVDGADGNSYSAKYEGAIKGTGIRKGTHFGIFSEVKPEMVIDGDTTALMHNKYPMLENAILQLHRTGSLNMGEMLGLNYAGISKTIDTLSRSGALSFPGGMRMPTFAAGRYPSRSLDGLGGLESLESLGSIEPSAAQQADIDSRNRLAAAIEAMVTQGVQATVNSRQASKALAKQQRAERRNGIRDGLYGAK